MVVRIAPAEVGGGTVSAAGAGAVPAAVGGLTEQVAAVRVVSSELMSSKM